MPSSTTVLIRYSKVQATTMVVLNLTLIQSIKTIEIINNSDLKLVINDILTCKREDKMIYR